MKKLFKVLCLTIILLAGAWQLYNLIWKKKIIDGGPLPIKEVQVLLSAAQELMQSKQFQGAVEKCQAVLKLKLKNDEVELAQKEAILNLKAIKKAGGNVPNLPELSQEIKVEDLPGGRDFFKKLKKKTIRVTGEGIAPKGKTGPAAKLMAKRAAKLDAYRRILEEIKGFEINKRINISSVMVQEKVSSRIKGFIQGAKEIESSFDPSEGIARVVLELSGENLLKSFKRNQ